jgi:hypothetical protein
MDESFFERPILNSPLDLSRPAWELDADGQPINRRIETRRRCDLITSVPKPQRRRRARLGNPNWTLAATTASRHQSSAKTGGIWFVTPIPGRGPEAILAWTVIYDQ